MLELIFPDEACFGSEDPPNGELLCPPEIFCIVTGLASAVRERAGSDSFPTTNASRLLLGTADRLNDPLDRPKKVEVDNCKFKNNVHFKI